MPTDALFVDALSIDPVEVVVYFERGESVEEAPQAEEIFELRLVSSSDVSVTTGPSESDRHGAKYCTLRVDRDSSRRSRVTGDLIRKHDVELTAIRQGPQSIGERASKRPISRQAPGPVLRALTR